MFLRDLYFLHGRFKSIQMIIVKKKSCSCVIWIYVLLCNSLLKYKIDYNVIVYKLIRILTDPSQHKKRCQVLLALNGMNILKHCHQNNVTLSDISTFGTLFYILLKCLLLKIEFYTLQRIAIIVEFRVIPHISSLGLKKWYF